MLKDFLLADAEADSPDHHPLQWGWCDEPAKPQIKTEAPGVSWAVWNFLTHFPGEQYHRALWCYTTQVRDYQRPHHPWGWICKYRYDHQPVSRHFRHCLEESRILRFCRIRSCEKGKRQLENATRVNNGETHAIVTSPERDNLVLKDLLSPLNGHERLVLF